jgi:hypothetical protein
LLHNHPHLSSGAGKIGHKWLQYKGFLYSFDDFDNNDGSYDDNAVCPFSRRAIPLLWPPHLMVSAGLPELHSSV